MVCHRQAGPSGSRRTDRDRAGILGNPLRCPVRSPSSWGPMVIEQFGEVAISSAHRCPRSASATPRRVEDGSLTDARRADVEIAGTPWCVTMALPPRAGDRSTVEALSSGDHRPVAWQLLRVRGRSGLMSGQRRGVNHVVPGHWPSLMEPGSPDAGAGDRYPRLTPCVPSRALPLRISVPWMGTPGPTTKRCDLDQCRVEVAVLSLADRLLSASISVPTSQLGEPAGWTDRLDQLTNMWATSFEPGGDGDGRQSRLARPWPRASASSRSSGTSTRWSPGFRNSRR